MIPCCLMLDEVEIKKGVYWDGKRFRGHVDIGDGKEEDESAPLATKALVFYGSCP